MGKSKHDQIAEQIARKKHGSYNPQKGADVVTPNQVIEVEVDPATLQQGKRQLQGYRGRTPYLGVPNDLVEDAIKATQGTGIGVMDEKGNIKRRGTKRKST